MAMSRFGRLLCWALANGDIATATSGMPFSEVNSLIGQVSHG
jgi:hypothetical protein